KAWRDTPVRRAGAAWSGQLGRELALLGDPVGTLARVNPSERAAVAPAAERVRAGRARPSAPRDPRGGAVARLAGRVDENVRLGPGPRQALTPAPAEADDPSRTITNATGG